MVLLTNKSNNHAPKMQFWPETVEGCRSEAVSAYTQNVGLCVSTLKQKTGIPKFNLSLAVYLFLRCVQLFQRHRLFSTPIPLQTMV